MKKPTVLPRWVFDFLTSVELLKSKEVTQSFSLLIERFYASALDGEMNVAMLQSRRKQKG
jgi:hypothetical protein